MNHETDMVPILGGPMPDTSSSPMGNASENFQHPIFSLRSQDSTIWPTDYNRTLRASANWHWRLSRQRPRSVTACLRRSMQLRPANGAVERLFKECKRRTVYKGPVDDRRTTDEAWIETVAVHFHAPEDIAAGLVLEVADMKEIRRVMWTPVHQIRSMYASHKQWVDAVARDMANIDASFTSQAASAVAPHALVSAVVAAAIAGVLARYAAKDL